MNGMAMFVRVTFYRNDEHKLKSVCTTMASVNIIAVSFYSFFFDWLKIVVQHKFK